MRSPRRALAAAAVAASLSLASPARGAESVERILAHVNSRIITQSLYDARFEQAVRDQGPPANAERAEEMKKKLFGDLIDEALLEDRARELDLITTDKEVEDQIKRLKEMNKVTSDEEFAAALAAQGRTIDGLRDELRRTMMVQRVIGREVNSKVDLSEDALRSIYEREKETWRIPEKAHLAEILISRGDDPAAAAERVRAAMEALRGGAKFDAVVQAWSEGPTKARGGDLGWVSRGELLPEIDKAVFSLPVGVVSEPIATKSEVHIVKVLEKAPVSYKPFSEVKADLLKREQETQFQKKLAEYLEKLRRDAVIRVAPDMTRYYTPPAPGPGTVDTPAASAETPEAAAPSGGATTSRDVRFELTPIAGWRFGGTTSELSNSYIDRIGVADTLSWGVTMEYRLSRKWNLELLWAHQDTEMRADLSALGAGLDRKISHLNVDTFQIGGMWLSGDPSNSARLYLDLLLGASLLTPSPGLSSVTRFSLSVGGGVKYFFSDHFGARLGLRWLPVYLNSKSAGYGSCSPYYGCYTYWGSTYLSQGDLYTGLTLGF